MMRKMRGIRFKPDMIKWIQEGKKTTTFRKTRRNGIYEIVKGSWFKPERLGIFIECKSARRYTKEQVIRKFYDTEGDFKDPYEFMEWLKKNKLYNKLPDEGWLNLVTFLHKTE